jgi:hypothetical protein
MTYSPQLLITTFIHNQFEPFLKQGDRILYNPEYDSQDLMVSTIEHLQFFYTFESAKESDGCSCFHIMELKSVPVFKHFF